jgi:glycosyltransferase involved in cell wall biosynthesis
MITLAFTYYNAPIMLEKQIEVWKTYKGLPVEILVIDDGSPVPAMNILRRHAKEVENLRLIRIREDIHMNLPGARNLAFKEATHNWVFQMDIDHTIFRDSVKKSIDQFKVKEELYIPDRYRAMEDGTFQPLTRHSDSFILHKDMFWDVGGYDEELREYYYSGPCFLLRKALKRAGVEHVNLDNIYIEFYSSNLIPDASPLSTMEDKKKYPGARTYHFNPDPKKQFQFNHKELCLLTKYRTTKEYQL